MNFGRIHDVSKPVSRLVFGTASSAVRGISADPSTQEGKERREASLRMIDQVLATGVNTFDCAALYGEEGIGEWMRLRGNREQVVILSKCAHPNRWRKRVTEHDILSDLKDSLCKLQTDYIDIYILHRDDPEVPVSVSVELFNKLHKDGIIGAFGASNWSHERIAEANRYALERGLTPFTVSSPNFGLADQVADPWGGGCVSISGPDNVAARDWYAAQQMPIFAYSCLARGFFSGKFRSNEPQKAEQLLDSAGKIGYYSPENFQRLERAEQLASEKRVSVAQIAMAWLFQQPVNVFAVSSTSSIERLQDTLAGMELPLTKQECAWLDLQTDELAR